MCISCCQWVFANDLLLPVTHEDCWQASGSCSLLVAAVIHEFVVAFTSCDVTCLECKPCIANKRLVNRCGMRGVQRRKCWPWWYAQACAPLWALCCAKSWHLSMLPTPCVIPSSWSATQLLVSLTATAHCHIICSCRLILRVSFCTCTCLYSVQC